MARRSANQNRNLQNAGNPQDTEFSGDPEEMLMRSLEDIGDEDDSVEERDTIIIEGATVVIEGGTVTIEGGTITITGTLIEDVTFDQVDEVEGNDMEEFDVEEFDTDDMSMDEDDASDLRAGTDLQDFQKKRRNR